MDTRSVTVVRPNAGIAIFDPILGAPACASFATFCDSTTLLVGRASRGPELNEPNTLADSCADGTSGQFHVRESLDGLKVSTVDGAALAVGKSVQVDATVWTHSVSSDFLDLYFTPSASSPSWTFVATLQPPVVGASVLSTTFTLPSAGLGAFRGTFRRGGSAATCGANSGFDDNDDLVFLVQSVVPVGSFAGFARCCPRVLDLHNRSAWGGHAVARSGITSYTCLDEDRDFASRRAVPRDR